MLHISHYKNLKHLKLDSNNLTHTTDMLELVQLPLLETLTLGIPSLNAILFNSIETLKSIDGIQGQKSGHMATINENDE